MSLEFPWYATVYVWCKLLVQIGGKFRCCKIFYASLDIRLSDFIRIESQILIVVLNVAKFLDLLCRSYREEKLVKSFPLFSRPSF